MPITVKELADYCGAEIKGGDPSTIIYSAADINSAQSGQVTQLTNGKYSKYLQDCAASACLTSVSLIPETLPPHMAILACDDPELSFIKAVELSIRPTILRRK